MPKFMQHHGDEIKFPGVGYARSFKIPVCSTVELCYDIVFSSAVKVCTGEFFGKGTGIVDVAFWRTREIRGPKSRPGRTECAAGQIRPDSSHPYLDGRSEQAIPNGCRVLKSQPGRFCKSEVRYLD